MEALQTIGWFLWLLLAIALLFELVGYRAMTVWFPEGRRAWHLPAQLGSLAFFAAAVLHHPWR